MTDDPIAALRRHIENAEAALPYAEKSDSREAARLRELYAELRKLEENGKQEGTEPC